MALKSISLTINPDKILQSNSVKFYRGDDIEFTLSFSESDLIDFDSVSKWRLKICPIIGGKIQGESTNIIALESEDVATWKVSASSAITAVPAGNYSLVIALLSDADAVAISTAFPIQILESGYNGVFNPTPDFRDEVLTASEEAIQAALDAHGFAVAAQTAASNAQTYASNASNSEGNALDHATNAEEARDSAQDILNDTQTLRDETEGFKNETEGLRDETQYLRDETENFRNDAELNASNAIAAVSNLFQNWSYRGNHDASSNTAPTPVANGYFWLISVGGTFGGITWALGDIAAWSTAKNAWQKFSQSNFLSAEQSTRIQHCGNKESKNAVELTSGYLTIPNSAPYLTQLPLTYCFTYTQPRTWGNNTYLLSHKKRYTRTGFAPDSGIEMIVQNNTNRTLLRIYFNSPNVDGDSFSGHQFDLLPTGTHSVCLQIYNTFSDGTTTSTSLPQKVSLFVDGVQWTPKVKAIGLTAEHRGVNTTSTSTLGTCNYYADALPADLHINAHSQDPLNGYMYRANVQISRVAIFGFILPATAASAINNYRYSVEQYAQGEAIPAGLMLQKDITSEITATTSSGAEYVISASGLTETITIPNVATQPDQVAFAFSVENSGIPAGAYVHVQLTSTLVPYQDYVTPHFRFSGNGQYMANYQRGIIYKNGVDITSPSNVSQYGINSIALSDATGVFDFWCPLNSASTPLSFSFIINTEGKQHGLQSGGTITLNKIEVFGAYAVLDQPFRGGNFLRDRTTLKLNGVVENQNPPLLEPVSYYATLKWTGTADGKAILSTSTSIIPPYSKISMCVKSTAATTINVHNGASTPTTFFSNKTLVADTWQNLGEFFVNGSHKLVIQPTANFSGTIYAQVRVEPMTT